MLLVRITWAILPSLLAILLLIPQPAVAQQPPEPLVKIVGDSIDRGVAFLKKSIEDRGGQKNWETGAISSVVPGGTTCLVMLALLTAGVPYTDPVIQSALPYLREIPQDKIYEVALQTMVLSEIVQAMNQEKAPPKDIILLQRQIQANVDWIWKARNQKNRKLHGWSYDTGALTWDNSNSQYAMLGLYAGRQAGATMKDADWREILDFYKATQAKSNGWYYSEQQTMPTLTMTVAGVSGLLIASREIANREQELDDKTGIAAKCGLYSEDADIQKGLRWIAEHFSFNSPGHNFYNIYGIERAGRLSGSRFLGEHDWYREGCKLLTGTGPENQNSKLKQRPDGSWGVSGEVLDGSANISTSFALLFLSKGRTPILISKLAHGSDEAVPGRIEWNRKHNDARHLAEYASKQLFRGKPMAWQVFDPRNADLSKKSVFEDELASLVQTPILYITGHERLQLTDQQKQLLKRYLEEGGFILGEACCGSKPFADSFRKLMQELFPDNPLEPLPPGHPIWSAHTLVKPTDFNQLEGLEMGCKTVAVLSPQPLAGFWEEQRFFPKDLTAIARERGDLSFRLAGNIIAYATGLEPPKPRLTVEKLVSDKEERKLPRSVLKLAQIRHEGDWQPAPQAMRHLAGYLREQFAVDIALQKDVVRMNEADASLYKLLYMHGRRPFTADAGELDNIRRSLDLGSLLFADACCGQKEFDTAFRDFAGRLYKDAKLETIKPDDALFSKELNGEMLTRLKLRTQSGEKFQDSVPQLEGIKVNGRWVVIYSRYDIGCALENHKSSACLGYDHDSALKLAAAALLYALNPATTSEAKP